MTTLLGGRVLSKMRKGTLADSQELRQQKVYLVLPLPISNFGSVARWGDGEFDMFDMLIKAANPDSAYLTERSTPQQGRPCGRGYGVHLGRERPLQRDRCCRRRSGTTRRAAPACRGGRIDV